MQSHFRHLLLLSSIWHVSLVNCAAISRQPLVPISITQPSQLTNWTNPGVNPIPPEFTILIDPTRGPELTDIVCLEGAIQVIGNHLALEDFTGKIPSQGWVYQGIVFGISTKMVPSRTDIERRFVIWGIALALYSMTKHKDFKSSLYGLKLHENIVGYLALYPHGYSGMNALFETGDIAQLDAPVSSVSGDSTNGSVTTVSAGELELRIIGVQPSALLEIHSLLVNIMNTLVIAATFPKNDRTRSSLGIRCPGFDVDIVIRSTLFTWKWVIKTMTLLSPFLARQGIRHAVKLQAWLGTVYLGEIEVLPKVDTAASISPSSMIEDGFNGSAISATA